MVLVCSYGFDKQEFPRKKNRYRDPLGPIPICTLRQLSYLTRHQKTSYTSSNAYVNIKPLFFILHNIKLLTFICTLTLTLTLHFFLFTVDHIIVYQSCTLSRIRVRIQLVKNCADWFPSEVAVINYQSSRTCANSPELYPNPHSNKN